MGVHQNVANASIAAAKIELDQVASQVRQIELQVATDVTNAAITVRNDTEAVHAAQIAERLAQEAYDAERTKLDVGLSTIFNVTQDLNALNAAKGSSLQAALNYENALGDGVMIGAYSPGRRRTATIAMTAP